MSALPKKAEICYLMPDGTRPIYIASDGGANAALNIQAKFENITVELFNAREFGNQFSLDIQGFELHEHSSKNSLAPGNAQPRQSIESRMFVFF